MAKNEGSELRITLATVEIDGLTNVSMSINNEIVDCTDFDSGGNRDILMSTTSWSFSATANVDGTETENFNEAFTALQAKSSVAVTLVHATPVTGDAALSGSGYITSIEKSGEIGSVISYSVTIEGTGALTNTPTV